MKKTWYVHLIVQPTQDVYRSDFFPRKFYYKKDAQELAEEVRKRGGVARVTDSPERLPQPKKSK